MTPGARHTLADALAQGEARLEAARLPDPRREALALLGALIGASPATTWTRRGEPLAEPEWERYGAVVAARARGVPAAYAIGTAAFRTLELRVDPRVLIPRPETEGLVERVLAWARREARWDVVVDVGTGSGCVALSLAREGRFARVVATDLSADALAVARGNARRYDVAIEFRLGDGLDPVTDLTADAIVANPPYVTADEWATLDPGVRDHEPRLALVAEGDGLGPTERLLREAPSRLRAGGLLAIEVDSQRGHEAQARAERLGWRDVRLEADLFGRPRYLLAIREDA